MEQIEYIEDPSEISGILSQALKSLLLEKIEDGVSHDIFSYVLPLYRTDTGDKETFMISYSDDDKYMIEKVPNDKYREHGVHFFCDNKETAITNAALYGHEFMIVDEDEESKQE